MTDFVLRGGTVVAPDRAPARRDVLVQKGKHLFTDDPDEFEKGRQLCIERDLGCG